MEKQLKLDSLLSLKVMALRKVAVLLWCDSGSLVNVSKFRKNANCVESIERDWRKNIIPNIEKKVLKLKLPKSIAKQIIEIVEPIGLQVKRWKDHHEFVTNQGSRECIIPNSENLCWTSAGLIDYQKTAEKLVCCDVLDVALRFELAAINCLEDKVPFLLEKLRKEKRNYYYDIILGNREPWYLFDCWPSIIKDEFSKLNWSVRHRRVDTTTHNPSAFEYSARKGNKVAAEYFFQKLSHEEREVSLMRTAKNVLGNFMPVIRKERLNKTVRFLLSLMNSKQQIEMIQKHPVCVVWCFLDCSWPDVFLENVGLFWSVLPPSSYKDLLKIMASVFDDHYFPKVFQEFFIQSPLDFKKCFVLGKYDFDDSSIYYRYDDSFARRFLSIFFKSEDSECIKVMFRNLSAVDRLKIMIWHDVLELFYICIRRDKLHMVRLCLREGLLSKEDREAFKKAFIRFLENKWKGPIDISNPRWKRYFKFIDETYASSDKEKKAQKRKLDNYCPE